MASVPQFEFTTLTPLLEVQHLILDELSPSFLLRLSKHCFDVITPRLYHTLSLDSENVDKVLYGATTPNGYKSEALGHVRRLHIGMNGRGDPLRSVLHDLFELSSVPRPLFSKLEHIHFGQTLWEPYDGPGGLFEALLPAYIPPCNISLDVRLFLDPTTWAQRDFNLARQRRLETFLIIFFHEASASHITFRLFDPLVTDEGAPPAREIYWRVEGPSKAEIDQHMLVDWLIPRLTVPSEEQLVEEMHAYFDSGVEDRYKFYLDDTADWDYRERYKVETRVWRTAEKVREARWLLTVLVVLVGDRFWEAQAPFAVQTDSH
ncbi:hypothetical protein IAT38_001941 [Cryptococcus sp. DSM 104549]